MDSDLLSRYAGHDAQTIAALGHFEYLHKLSLILPVRFDLDSCKHCAHLADKLRAIFGGPS